MSIPHEHNIPDPGPTPDELVADLLDGQASPLSPLARVAGIICHLPPAIADAIAAEYARACRLSRGAVYRPTIAGIARAAGIADSTMRDAIAAARRACAADCATDRATRRAGRPTVPRHWLASDLPPRGSRPDPSPPVGFCAGQTRSNPATNGARQCARLTRANAKNKDE